uniref:lactoylglutathione lyase n=1 Tax=Haptolina brevifila TaxID=156173 RepID=A0A7S2GKZ5_9EUKA
MSSASRVLLAAGGLASTSMALRVQPMTMMAAAPTVDVSKFYTSAPPAETKGYIMQQTMVRVKDPQASLRFYCEVLGFNLLMHREFPQWGFNVYFVAPCAPSTIPSTPEEQWELCMTTPGTIELTWNYGSETENGKVYNTGNSDATGSQDGQKVRGGFGHLGITVPDVYEACERFKALGCEFTKTPNGGGMKGLAFIKDPDGYLIEILPQGPMITKPIDCDGVTVDGGSGYVDKSK